MVMTILDEIRRRLEQPHLQHLLHVVDFRGGAVRLDAVGLCVMRQDFPYPAFVWEWGCIQCYKWVQPQHINVLEVIAVFNYIRAKVGDRARHSERFSISAIAELHVL